MFLYHFHRTLGMDQELSIVPCLHPHIMDKIIARDANLMVIEYGIVVVYQETKNRCQN